MFLCLKMRARIWGYLGQMAHRRQIAQWSGTRTAHRRQIAQWAGTRTTHPGGTGFETGVRDRYLPKTRECVSPFPQGLFMPPKTRPRVFPEAKVAFRVDETLVWHTRPDPADPADPPDWCHQVPLRPSLPHAPGVRMTAVITNSLK